MDLYRAFAFAPDPQPHMPGCLQMWLRAEREARIAYQLAIHRSIKQ